MSPQHERNLAIWAKRVVQRQPWATIARRHGISPSRVRMIVLHVDSRASPDELAQVRNAFEGKS